MLVRRIARGFNLLGQNVRKYGDKVLIKPARKSVQALLTKVSELLGKNKAASQSQVIMKLNPILSGWAMYHRHVVAAATFSRSDRLVWQKLWRWAKRRHPTKERALDQRALIPAARPTRLDLCVSCRATGSNLSANAVAVKARKPYEFGVKVSITTTYKEGLVVGARSMPGNPYDGHTLA
jgi:hypothetical protein